MTKRSPRIRQTRGPDRPLIASELDRLREKPPRASKNEPIDQLERLAILNGIRDGDAPSRIARQWSISTRTVERVKTKLYADPLSIFGYHVVIHRGTGAYQCVFGGEARSRSQRSWWTN